MPDSLGIDELRRRVQKDPASIAFAHLAEELRKAGQYDEAVRVCRTGLERHPTYLTARVTLGRALLGLQHYGEARTEIEYVLHAAPDNLLALKCMTELEAHPSEAPPEPPRQSQSTPAPEPAKLNLRVQTAPEPAKAGPHGQSAPAPAEPNLRIQTSEPANVEPPVAMLVAEAAPEPGAGAVREGGPSSQHWPVGSLSDPTLAKAAGPHDQSVPEPAPQVQTIPALPNGGPPAEHPAIEELQDWQARIQADRAKRSGGTGPQDRPR